MTDEEGIRRTIAQYCLFCDEGRFEEWADLYTEDAKFTVMGVTHVGRDEAKAFIEKGQPEERRGKHCCFNTVIDYDGDGDDRARASTDYIFVNREKQITSAGRYVDVLVKQDDRWRFAEREIVFLGS